MSAADPGHLEDGHLADGTPVRAAIPCRRCGQWLVNTESVVARLGPVCAGHERVAQRRNQQSIPLFDLADPGGAEVQ